jgi:hypothetical protein
MARLSAATRRKAAVGVYPKNGLRFASTLRTSRTEWHNGRVISDRGKAGK